MPAFKRRRNSIPITLVGRVLQFFSFLAGERTLFLHCGPEGGLRVGDTANVGVRGVDETLVGRRIASREGWERGLGSGAGTSS